MSTCQRVRTAPIRITGAQLAACLGLPHEERVETPARPSLVEPRRRTYPRRPARRSVALHELARLEQARAAYARPLALDDGAGEAAENRLLAHIADITKIPGG